MFKPAKAGIHSLWFVVAKLGWLIILLIIIPNLYSEETKKEIIKEISQFDGLYVLDETYQIVIDDSIIVYITGDINETYNLIVMPEGKIYIPVAGEIKIAGLNLKECGDLIKKEISKYYQNTDVKVTILKPNKKRQILKDKDIVTIYGDVYYPGIYNIEKGEKASSIIYKAGGFKTNVDLKNTTIEREIQGRKEIIAVDLNEIIIKKNLQKDIELVNGDKITVPQLPHLVNVIGSVSKPGAYEYSPGAPVSYYVGLSGGFTEKSSRSINITRLDNRKVESENYIPEPGDTIYIPEQFFSLVSWRDYMQLLFDFLALYTVYSVIFKK